MKEIRFDWDSDKAKLNVEKHGVAFEEPESVFYDEQAIQLYDDERSEWEDRFLMLDLSARYLIVGQQNIPLSLTRCQDENAPSLLI